MKINDIERKIVVIIKGNPEKMIGKEALADEYYERISEYVSKYGYTVEFDDGEEYTCPREDATFLIAHSRGVDRERCIDDEDRWKFLKFGVLDGIIHPVDKEWQESLTSYQSDEMPPEEHFEFTKEQKEAIDVLISKLDDRNDT